MAFVRCWIGEEENCGVENELGTGRIDGGKRRTSTSYLEVGSVVGKKWRLKGHIYGNKVVAIQEKNIE